MEVLGSAATIVQLVSFTAEVLALGYGYLAKAKKAPLEVKSLMREVTYLNELLEQLEELATENEAGTVKGAVWRSLGLLRIATEWWQSLRNV
jgi:hypothetical protein